MAQVNKSPEKDQPTTLATLPAVDEPVTTVPQVMNATGQKTKIDAKNQWVTAEFDAPSGSSSGVAASGIVMFNFHNIPPLTRVDATFDYAKNNVKLEVAKRAQPFGMKARTEPVLVSFAAEGMESAHFEITAQNIRTVVLKAVDVSNGYGESWPDFQKYLDRPLFTYSLSQKDADPKTLEIALKPRDDLPPQIAKDVNRALWAAMEPPVDLKPPGPIATTAGEGATAATEPKNK